MLAACATFCTLTAAPAAGAGPCSDAVVHDYAAPLAAMPPLTPLAAGRTTLPFGPRGLTLIHRPARQVALVGTEEGVGFVLTTAAARKRPVRPGWLVSTRMVKVSEAGSTERVIETHRARVEKLAPHRPLRLGLGVSGEPGFYRVEIVFRNRAGKLLGRFGEYRSILAGSLDVRFSLDTTAVHPGETIDPRLENIGAAYLSFGLGARIEVLQAGGWALRRSETAPCPRSESCWGQAKPPPAGGRRSPPAPPPAPTGPASTSPTSCAPAACQSAAPKTDTPNSRSSPEPGTAVG